jgi:hypothetical protein
VKPDVAVTGEEALETAHKLALEKITKGGGEGRRDGTEGGSKK